MNELLELQTGQVAFISGLMSGFSLTVGVNILRYGIRSRTAQFVFVSLLLSSLLFLVALYVDVRLTIEFAGIDSLSAELSQRVKSVRIIGTASATFALFLFVISIGLLGWLATPLTGVLTSLLAAGVLYMLWRIWTDINIIAALLLTQ